ncbi:MAG: sugar phosphate isomerase/epimerase [bacterium]|nr:sugar phosphate isomerase/epimerase [bacterium]
MQPNVTPRVAIQAEHTGHNRKDQLGFLRRRRFLGLSGMCIAGLAAGELHRNSYAAAAADALIATNTYPWETFARRNNENIELHTDHLLSDIASTGIRGYEPNIRSLTDFDGLQQRLSKHGLEMPSIYVNSVLHDASQSAQSMEQVLAIAERAVALGTTILVTNPSPIRWGGDEDKSDAQLQHQAKSLDVLGEKLRALGVTLAYHNHDSELRQGAREFHHMLTATSPQNVRFCLDAHWIYRGCGNSQLALFDAVEHYADRIVELHLRQSRGGVWTESFTMEGDIDYPRLFDVLRTRGIQTHLVLEQAVEAGSPSTLGVVEAHRVGNANLRSHLS